jgi:hypothetical protein
LQNGVVLRDVDAEIADARAQLAELDRRREVVAQRLADLNRLRASGDTGARADGGTELSAASKIELFRDLFRGREDVFAVRWANRAKGSSGYAPRCANEWKHGLCHKPKVRCGSCTNQAFVSFGDRELLAHLQGRAVVGIYPLLPDDTCRLLAIDLDGASWRADARAIRATCRSLDLEPTIERSRSGNGAHVWLFFTHSVAAADARQLGFYILTETMARGAALGVASYTGCSRVKTCSPKPASETSSRCRCNGRLERSATLSSWTMSSNHTQTNGRYSPLYRRSLRIGSPY